MTEEFGEKQMAGSDDATQRQEGQPVKSSIYTYQIPTAAAAKEAESGGQNSAKKKKENLWKSILEAVVKRDDQKDSFVVLLGDKGAGKRSLIREINSKYILCRNKHMPVEEMGSDFAALDFSFLYVKDLADGDQLNNAVSSEDNLPRLNIWTLQDSEKGEMLEAVLKPSSLEQTVAVIVLDLDTPWEMMNQLRKWIKTLQNSLFNMFPNMEPGAFEKLKQKLEMSIKTYEEPDVDENGKLIKKRKEEKANASDDSDLEDNLKEELELDEGVLKVNLGIPIVVICNKVDLLQHGEKAKFLAENMDFIQKSVREYALQYGATVIFTSSLVNRNVDTFYQYLLHRLYGCEFAFKPNLEEKDNLFIPSGFDSLNQIEALKKGIIGAVGADGQPLSFEDVIKPIHMTSMASRRAPGGSNQGIVECPEWYQLLQHRMLHGKQPDLSKQSTTNPRRNTKLQTGPSSKVMASHDQASTIKTAVSPRESASQADAAGLNQSQASAASGQARQKANGSAYFKKLLQNDRFRAQKQQRQSQLMAEAEGRALAEKLQANMDESGSSSAQPISETSQSAEQTKQQPELEAVEEIKTAEAESVQEQPAE